MSEQRRIPAVIMRGGTSKGVFFREDVLPEDPAERDRMILRVFGSPDPYGRQIDGLGGATSTTSKVAIIGRSQRPGCDVDYLFGQVSIDRPLIDYSGNCGNLSAAVGPFAMEEGMMTGSDPETIVRIWQVNTRKRMVARIPTRDGLPEVTGAFQIDGVPGSGAEIRLEFEEPGGAGTGRLLPTGRVVDWVDLKGVGRIRASLVDAGNPAVFVQAEEALGLKGVEGTDAVDDSPALRERLEQIRAWGAVAMGLARSPQEATQTRPATPKVAFVAPPAAYPAQGGVAVAADSVDLVARIMSMGRLHRAYAITGAVATAVAARIPGTVVHEVARTGGDRVRIGHPSGVVVVGATVERRDGEWVALRAEVSRTARRLMEGWVRVPVDRYA